jgi:hypothetical protein
VRTKLSYPVDFQAGKELTLQDALDWLTDRYDLTFNVDCRAFEAKKVADVLGTNIASGEGWSLKGVDLKDVLRRLLSKGPLSEAGATYVIIDNAIVITTEEWATYRWMRQPVSVDCAKGDLASVLKKLAGETGTNLVLDPRVAKDAQAEITLKVHDVPLETAVCLLAEMAHLKPVRFGNVLFLTTKANAAELRADKDRAPLIGPCPLPTDVKVPALP